MEIASRIFKFRLFYISKSIWEREIAYWLISILLVFRNFPRSYNQIAISRSVWDFYVWFNLYFRQMTLSLKFSYKKAFWKAFLKKKHFCIKSHFWKIKKKTLLEITRGKRRKKNYNESVRLQIWLLHNNWNRKFNSTDASLASSCRNARNFGN